ncbi:hypothetical protein, partial [Heliobacterium chlorum]|uniref:hypothetical protein n=1 Tax=Heliobacterium chlorum TaxID=2698 RepID=UPI001A9B3C0F
GQKLFARSESFKQLGLLHSQFHQKCAEAIQMYKKNNIIETKKLNLELERLSAEIFKIMDELKQSVTAK